jgi:thiol:disulfide interchange protein DsbC
MRTVAAILLTLSLLTTPIAFASDKAEQHSDRIKTALEEKFPGIRIEAVHAAPWEGLYEVVTEGELAYTNNDATLLFSGRILDTKTKEDLTKKRWNELQSIDFRTLPFDLAIKIVRGNGSKQLAVFADPDCPYCQQLEQQLKDVSDTTIFVFLYPLESLHPKAKQHAENIWCADNRAGAWTEWMLNRVEPVVAGACSSTPIDTLAALGTKLKINSTPTIFFADGRRAAGVLQRDQLIQKLSAARQQ